jgi:hypothetical protein
MGWASHADISFSDRFNEGPFLFPNGHIEFSGDSCFSNIPLENTLFQGKTMDATVESVPAGNVLFTLAKSLSHGCALIFQGIYGSP